MEMHWGKEIYVAEGSPSQEVAICKPREALRGTSAAGPQILDLQPGGHTFQLLGHFIHGILVHKP